MATVAVPRNVEFRKACIVCGKKKGVTFRERDFHYINPVVLLPILLIGWIAFPLLRRFLQKSARLSLPYCKECEGTALRAKTAEGPVAITFIVVGMATATAALNGAPVVAAVIASLGFSVAVGLLFLLMGGAKIRVTRIDDTTVWIRGAHPSALPAVVED